MFDYLDHEKGFITGEMLASSFSMYAWIKVQAFTIRNGIRLFCEGFLEFEYHADVS